jgi:hypothetical protein
MLFTHWLWENSFISINTIENFPNDGWAGRAIWKNKQNYICAIVAFMRKENRHRERWRPIGSYLLLYFPSPSKRSVFRYIWNLVLHRQG